MSPLYAAECCSNSIILLSEGLGLRDARRRPVSSNELDPSWKTYEAPIDNFELRVVAHGRRRAEALAIFDPRTVIPYSAYSVLEVIAKTGPNGITQAELAKRLGLASKDIFHQVKSLTKLGLISRSSVVGHQGKPIATVRLCLKKYENVITDEWQLDPENPAPIEEDDDDDEGNPTQEEAVKHRLVRYSSMAWFLCEQLARVPGAEKVMRPIDLKENLKAATPFKKGSYRTVRDKLVALGYITFAFVESETEPQQRVKCIRLLKRPKNVEELDSALTTTFAPAKQENLIPLLIEYPLEYQIYLMVHQRAKFGLLQSDLKFPGVLHKAVANRIIRLKDRGSINTKIENQGKMRTAVLAPCFEPSIHLPLVPRYGTSVPRSALAVKLEEGESLPPLPSLPPTPKATPIKRVAPAIESNIQFSSPGAKHKPQEASIERQRRLQFIRNVLEKDNFVTRPKLLSMMKESFPGVDNKTLGGLVNELMDNGEAVELQTTVDDRLTKAFVRPDMPPSEFLKAIQKSERLPQPAAGPDHYKDAETLVLPAKDVLHLGSFLPRKSLDTGRRQWATEDETGEEVISDDEPEEDEEIEYMDTDDEEAEYQRRAARHQARRERIRADLANAGHDRRHVALSHGYEKLKVDRAAKLHIWLCQHHFFQRDLNPEELPNDIETIVEKNKEANVAEALQVLAEATTGETPSRFLQQLGRLGSRQRESSSTSAAPAPEAEAAPEELPTEPLTKSEVESRWFSGTSFNVESLLPELPLYLYMKIIGIAHVDIPGLPDPSKHGDLQIKDLPAEARAYLLKRTYYENQLTPAVDLLKRLNLLRAPAAIIERPATGGDSAPVLKLVVLNPVALIQYRLAADPTKSVQRKERLFTFCFDRVTPQTGKSEASRYWRYLKRSMKEYNDSVKQVNEQTCRDFEETLDPFVPGAFPSRANQLGLPTEERLWSEGASRSIREKATVPKSLWDVILIELEASKQSPTDENITPTSTMLEISKKSNIHVDAVLNRCLRHWRKQQKEKPEATAETDFLPARSANSKKRKAPTAADEDGDDDVAPKAKKPKERAHKPSAAGKIFNIKPDEENEVEEESDEEEDEMPQFRRASRLGARQRAAFLNHFIEMKARASGYLDDLSQLFEGIDKNELALKSNRPWERLETFILDYVKDHTQFRDLSSSIASKRRELADVDEMEDEQSKEVIFTLPASIDDFRAQNTIIHSNSHQIALYKPQETGEDDEEEDPELDAWLGIGSDSATSNFVNNNYLHFSYSTKRLFTQILPLSEAHAVHSIEERVNTPNYAAGLSAPASTWMLPNPVDPIISDAIKTILSYETASHGQTILAAMSPKMVDICFEALRIRRIMLSGKLGLTSHWKSWNKHALTTAHLAHEARESRQILMSEESGTVPVAPEDETGEYRMWKMSITGIISPGMTAALIHGAAQQEIVLDAEVGALTPAMRRTRRAFTVTSESEKGRAKQSAASRARAAKAAGTASSSLEPTATAASSDELKPASNRPVDESDQLAMSVSWWREPDLLNRCLVPLPWEEPEDPIDHSLTNTSRLDILISEEAAAPASKSSKKKSSSSAPSTSAIPSSEAPETTNEDRWSHFVKLQESLYDDTEEWIDFCKSILDLVVAAESKSIEKSPLASALFAQGYLMPSHYTGIPSLESVKEMESALEQLANCGLVIRVLGEFEEAWVAPEFSAHWMISLKAKEGEYAEPMATENDERPLEKVPFLPWTNYDGSQNTEIFNQLCAHLAHLIIASPGITEESLLDKFILFRPSVCRELLHLLEVDQIVEAKYQSYTPSISLFPGHVNRSSVGYASEPEYHEYLWLKSQHIRNGAPSPKQTVIKSFWPVQNAHFLL